MSRFRETHVEATAHAGTPTAENRPSRAAGRGVPRHYLHNHAWDCSRTPHAGIAPQSASPAIAVALTTFVVPRGRRRAIWATVGFRLRRGRGLLIAVLGPVAIIALSFAAATALGVVRFPGLAPGFGLSVLNLAITTFIFAVVFPVVYLVEEIGWRGYLPTLPTGRGDLRTTCGPAKALGGQPTPENWLAIRADVKAALIRVRPSTQRWCRSSAWLRCDRHSRHKPDSKRVPLRSRRQR